MKKKNILLITSLAFSLAACGGNENGHSDSVPEPTAEVKDGSIELTKNANGEDVEIIHEGLKAYIDAMYEADAETDDEEIIYGVREVSRSADGYMCPGVKASDYRTFNGTKDLDDAKPVKLEWEGEGDYILKYATNKLLEDAKELTITAGNSAEIVNLFADTTYYWQVATADGEHDSKLGSFHTNGHFRTIKSAPAYNVRDIGGKPNKDGKRIKQGLIYRGCELVDAKINSSLNHGVTLSSENLGLFRDELHIGYEFDLRKEDAIGTQVNSSLGEDIDYKRLALGSFADLWNSGKPSELREAFEIFKNATPDKAVYCHCWGGADRTGTLIFILEGLLGVSMLEACMDYELTSFDNGAHERYRDIAVQNYDFPSFIKAVKSSQHFEEGKSLQATMETWMIDRVGFTEDEVEELKDNLLEDVPIQA